MKIFFRKCFRKVLSESVPESVFQKELCLKNAIKPKNRGIYGYIGFFRRLGKNHENRVFRWKISHFGQKSQKLGVYLENFPFQAKIPKTGCLAGKFLIFGKNPEKRVFCCKFFSFWAKLPKVGCLAGKFLIMGKSPENRVFSWKLPILCKNHENMSNLMKYSPFRGKTLNLGC